MHLLGDRSLCIAYFYFSITFSFLHEQFLRIGFFLKTISDICSVMADCVRLSRVSEMLGNANMRW